MPITRLDISGYRSIRKLPLELGPVKVIVSAAKHSQVWVTTHAEPLARVVAERSGCEPVHLVKHGGATEVAEAGAEPGEED